MCPRAHAFPASTVKRVQPKEDTSRAGGRMGFLRQQEQQQTRASQRQLEKPLRRKGAASAAPSIAASNPADTVADCRRRDAFEPQLGRRVSAPPKKLGNNVILQVAAVTHQSDALAMADALAAEKVPVLRGGALRRQFLSRASRALPDERAADNAKSELDRAGFKAIIKR